MSDIEQKDLEKDKESFSKKQQEEFTTEFLSTFARSVAGNYINLQPMFNPYLQNQLLKDINMNPNYQDRDRVEELLKNPSRNEQPLREVSQYLFNKIMQYKQLVNYYSTMLTFDYVLEPTNADEEDMKTDKFKKSYNKVCDWLDEFNPKKTFQEVLQGVIIEESKYFYVRESKEGVRLQEMPSNYCKIIRKTDYGYQYAFNMMYFLKYGIDFDDYAPEFKEYYLEFLNLKDAKNDEKMPEGIHRENKCGVYYFWKELNPLKAPVFKFDETVGGSVPPLAPTFTNAIDISTYNDLFKAKTELDVWKIIINKLPLHKDGKNENLKNPFAIDPKIAGSFTSMMQSQMPQGVRVATVPFDDSQVVDFSQTQSQNGIINAGNKLFWKTSGNSGVIFGDADNPNALGLKASLMVDESFVEKFYGQAERFVNLQLRQISGRYRWKCHFEGTKYSNITEERVDNYLKLAQYGLCPIGKVASSIHMTPRQLTNILKMEQQMGTYDLLKPIMSSHTMNGKENGSPKKSISNLTDSGMQTLDRGDNDNKI